MFTRIKRWAGRFATWLLATGRRAARALKKALRKAKKSMSVAAFRTIGLIGKLGRRGLRLSKALAKRLANDPQFRAKLLTRMSVLADVTGGRIGRWLRLVSNALAAWYGPSNQKVQPRQAFRLAA